jgi:hypothetical protein
LFLAAAVHWRHLFTPSFNIFDMEKRTHAQSSVLVISMGFLVIFFLKDWLWAAWISLAIGIMGVLSSFLTKIIDYLWMSLAKALGWFMPKILLGLVFYLVLFPVSVLAGLFGRKDFLQLKLKSDTASTYSSFNRNIDKNYFEKPW